jgi:hypothetical protein
VDVYYTPPYTELYNGNRNYVFHYWTLVLFNHPLSEIVTKTKPAIRNQNFEVDSVRWRFGQSGLFLKRFLAGGR